MTDKQEIRRELNPEIALVCQLCGQSMGDEVGDVHKKCADYENAL